MNVMNAKIERDSMSDVLVIGGHGKIALLLAPALVEQGHTVTSVVRNPEHVSDVEETGATALVLDVEHASVADMAEAFSGRDVIVWSAGAGGGDPARTHAVDQEAAIRSMDAAKAAGVSRYVMVSYFGARVDHGVPKDNPFFAYADAKAAADAHLRESGLDWTILGPGVLTTEDPSGRIDVDPDIDRETDSAETSRANVAHTIVAAIADGASIGRQYEFKDGSTPIADALR